MSTSLIAILAMCGNDPMAAFRYCLHISVVHPELDATYTEYALELMRSREMAANVAPPARA